MLACPTLACRTPVCLLYFPRFLVISQEVTHRGARVGLVAQVPVIPSGGLEEAVPPDGGPGVGASGAEEVRLKEEDPEAGRGDTTSGRII